MTSYLFSANSYHDHHRVVIAYHSRKYNLLFFSMFSVYILMKELQRNCSNCCSYTDLDLHIMSLEITGLPTTAQFLLATLEQL